MQGAHVQSLVRELRSTILRGMAKKKKKRYIECVLCAGPSVEEKVTLPS